MTTLLLFLAMPMVLGSVISFAIMLVYIPIIVMRIRNEEKVLAKGLPGYEEYMKTDCLPRNHEEIKAMSDAWMKRMETQRQEKTAKRKKEILREIESQSSEAALEAAVDIIRRQQPELLRDDS